MTDKIASAMNRYAVAAHAMQSGVAAKMELDPAETSPKHLRTGINSALRDSSSLARLLIDKGVITREEYITAQADGMEEEAEMYRVWLEQRTGTKITLA